MGRILRLALIAAILAVLALLAWWPDEGSAPVEKGAGHATAPAAIAEPGVTGDTDAPDRTAAPTPQPIQIPLSLPGLVQVQTTLALGGLVVDLDGTPIPKVAITFDGKPMRPPVETDAAGRFRAMRPAQMGVLGIDDPRYVVVLEPTLFDSDQEHTELTIVVSLCTPLRGVVVDTEDMPVANATISATTGIDARARIARVLDRDVDAKLETRSAADGSFELARAPIGSTAQLHVSARGYQQLDVSVDDALGRSRFVLRRRFEGDTLRGLVVDEKGQGVPGARTELNDFAVNSADDGSFVLELWRVGELPSGLIPALVVSASNRLPVRVRALDPAWRTRNAWPADLTLRIGSVGANITGRVLFADGTPVAQPQVTFMPPQPARASGTLFPASDDDGDTSWWESVGDRGDTAQGAFATDLVEPGRYRLCVTDPVSLEVFITGEIATGSHDVTIRMPASRSWPALHGVVVDRSGAPVPGADWIVERDDPTPGAQGPVNDGWHNATRDGVIDHPPYARAVHTLCVKAAGMAEWHRFPLAELPDPTNFRVVVPVGCHARVEADGAWHDVDLVRLVDATGAASPVVITQGNIAWGTRDIGIVAGRSQTFVALDDCVEMWLYRRGQVVRRVPIHLTPSGVHVLRP